MKHISCSLWSVAALAAVGVPALHADVTPPAGYIYSPLPLAALTQSCVAAGPGGTFVGIGRSFTANAGAVVLVKESGTPELVAFGFNSIADCAYDADNDVLYVSDNADNADLQITVGGAGNTAAQSGDTVFAIPFASQAPAMAAADLELLPAGSLEHAANLAVAGDGNLLVGTAAGAGGGVVLEISPGPTSSVFASGFDFTGGIAVTGAGDVLVGESLSSFANQVHRFDSSGAVIASPLVGPSFAIGSVDLAVSHDGRILATGLFGGDVVAIDLAGPSTSSFAGGLTFAGGITVDGFTGRVALLSSSFTGGAEDRTVHRFVPVARLEPGKAAGATECLHEFYGIELVAEAPGDEPKKAICTDGAACDSDGAVNDRCVFAVGSCFNVNDARLPECVVSAELVAVEANPGKDRRAFDDYQESVATALPILAPTCVFTDGVVVPVIVKNNGEKKDGKAKIAVAVANSLGKKDKDSASLVCRPAP
ncbi:MAG TPA: hypothetical protein VEB21_18330 [Terriglobales bacterium]|nr:hypothetical protein [Terriglobales bacterium]